jgi:PKD repeat protein
MVLKSREYILSYRNKRAITILLGFLMIVSGMFITTVSIGAGINAPRGARQGDTNNSSNDFTPEIMILEPNATSSYTVTMLNTGNEYFIIIVEVADDDNVTTNGSAIASVELNLTGFYEGTNPLGWESMVFDGANWTYNLSIEQNQPLGTFYVNINATDNGTVGFERWNNTYDNMGQNITVNINQCNRNLTIIDEPDIVMDEDGPDKYLDLNNTVFLDPDLDDVNISDSLTFKVWDGDSWENSYDGPDFTVTIAAGVDGNVTFHPKPDMYTALAGEDVDFMAMDTGGHWKDATINVKVNPMNDMPAWIWIDPTGTPAPDSVDFVEDVQKNITLEVDDPDMDDTFLYEATLYFNIGAMFGFDDFWYDYDTVDVVEIGNNQVNLSFNMGDAEVCVAEYGLYLNISVYDGHDTVNTTTDIVVTDMNDMPELYYAEEYDGETVDFEVDEDEMGYNITFLALDPDPSEDLTFNYDVLEYPDHAIEATYTTKMTLDYETLPPFYDPFFTMQFFPGSGYAMLNFTPDNNDVGNLKVNVSVTDGDGKSAWLISDITIVNTNDAPMFTQAAGSAVTTGDMLDYTGTNNITAEKEYLNITIEADDVDLMHGAESLTFDSDASDAVLTITPWGETKANLSFWFPKSYEGTDTYNITVTDGEEGDWFHIQVEVWVEPSGPVIPTNHAPKITELSASSGDPAGFIAGTEIEFEANASDEDAGDTVQYKWDWGDGSAETGWSTSGTATHVFATAGTYNVTLTVKDSKNEEDVEVMEIEIEDKPVTPPDDDDDDDDEEPLSMGLFAYDILIIIIIIVVIVIVVAVVAMKKKPEEEEALAPPPTEMTCTACGATIPAGDAVCPACGAAAPPPAEAPAEATCTSCGQIIPAGSMTCPACGAPAPPPAEAPPEVLTCVTCGQVIPPGSPSCPACGAPAPPMGPPPEEEMPPAAPPPDTGMAPPPEGAMPPEGAPPDAGMPPAEGAPPQEQPPAGAPPAQTVPCPQCQQPIGVGMTPCPSCGAQLNWG